MLQASIVTPVGLVFPLMCEPIVNADACEEDSAQKKKQDCETKAFYRLAPRLAKRFPRLPLALLMDGLYPTGPVFALCNKHGWKFIIGLSDDQLVSVNEEFHALVKMCPQNACSRDTGKNGAIHQDLVWANDIGYQDTKKHSHTLDVLQCREAVRELSGMSSCVKTRSTTCAPVRPRASPWQRTTAFPYVQPLSVTGRRGHFVDLLGGFFEGPSLGLLLGMELYFPLVSGFSRHPGRKKGGESREDRPPFLILRDAQEGSGEGDFTC